MSDDKSRIILKFLAFLTESDIKDLVFLLSKNSQQAKKICNAHQLLANVGIWYGNSAPSAIYQALLAANMSLIGCCILNNLPEVAASSPDCISPLRRLLFNIAVQFPDADVPRVRELLNSAFSDDGDANQSDAIDIMARLLTKSIVWDRNIQALRRLSDLSPVVSNLIEIYAQNYSANSERAAEASTTAASNAAAAVASVTLDPASPVQVYPMKFPVCVIINVQRNRAGSEIDVRRLQDLFNGFGYIIFKLLDPSREDVLKKIQEMQKMFKMFNNFDCLVVFVMAHGHDDYIELTNQDRLHYWQDIVKPFLDGCLRGRPKIFFFQCCRGELLQEAQLPLQFDGPVAIDRPQVSQQDHRDLYVCHSTFQGFAAIREEQRGSWFIQTLCDVLEGPVRMDLECLRMTVTRKLQDRRVEVANNLVNQTPVVEKNTLTGHIYLKPENM